jgi:hypothetical protein
VDNALALAEETSDVAGRALELVEGLLNEPTPRLAA